MKRSNFKIMTGLMKLISGLHGYMAFAILLGVIGFLCSISLTFFASLLLLSLLGIDIGVSYSSIVWIMLLAAFLRGAFRYIEQACNHYIAFHLLAQIREKVFIALRKLCPAKLEGKEKGNLISLITSDIELLEVFYAHTLSPIAIAFLVSIILVIVFYQMHPLLALWAFISYFFVGMVLPYIISKKTQDIGILQRETSGALSAFVLDRLRGLQEVLQYHQEKQTLQQLDDRSIALSKLDERFKKTSGHALGMVNTSIMVLSILMLALASYLYDSHIISYLDVLLSFVLLFSSFGPVVALANLGTTLQQTLACGERVLALLEEQPQVEEVVDGVWVSGSEMQVEDVSFGYTDQTILSDISFSIPTGKTIGLYGRSGSGKSTLLKLLMRFWDVNDGSISLGDVNIKKIDTQSLRSKQSYMTQETHLFHDTIIENIRIAKSNATKEEVIEACKKASIHDHIMSLPQGYETNASELGASLSGGEKQRIGLARAFLHDSPLLLLDEPTSNLDSLNEAVILEALAKVKANRNIVLVSHRKSTMKLADSIIEIEKGKMKSCK